MKQDLVVAISRACRHVYIAILLYIRLWWIENVDLIARRTRHSVDETRRISIILKKIYLARIPVDQ